MMTSVERSRGDVRVSGGVIDSAYALHQPLPRDIGYTAGA